jgi:hypothetical protein
MIYWLLLFLVSIIGAYICNILTESCEFSGSVMRKVANVLGIVFCVAGIVSIFGVAIV